MTSVDNKIQLQSLVDCFELPEKIGFGNVMVPVMYKAEYCNGQWSEGEMLPYGPISLDPAAKVLHYAAEVFEGLKAYWVDSTTPQLFRPECNFQRLNASAERMCMPALPEALFMNGICSVTRLCQTLIPRKSGTSLYLRPFMIATEPDLSMSVSSRYAFYVIASPSEVYHAGSMKVLVERRSSRAAHGGVGAAKTGGNYAAALQAGHRCVEQGYDQILWLNSRRPDVIDELSGMNFFAVMDGTLHTPTLNGSILPGITRASLLTLAAHMGLKVYEREMNINDLFELMASGTCTEAFACGTAAIISPISLIGDADGKCCPLMLKDDAESLALTLRERLLNIQEGRVEDPFGWIVPVT